MSAMLVFESADWLVVAVDEEGLVMTMFDEMGRVPSPFRVQFIDATERAIAEKLFRRDHGHEWQIDEIKVNMFCAMVIYHHRDDPTR